MHQNSLTLGRTGCQDVPQGLGKVGVVFHALGQCVFEECKLCAIKLLDEGSALLAIGKLIVRQLHYLPGLTVSYQPTDVAVQ